MKISFVPHTLEFKYPFKIAYHSRSTTPVVITEITCDGMTGYGEASLPPYLTENTDSVFRFLTKAEKVLAEYKCPFDLEAILDRIDLIEWGNNAAKASIDIALHDLKGRMEGRPCYQFWNSGKIKMPYTSVTLGIDRPEIILKKLKDTEAFRILKVKLGGADDVSVIDTIRSYTDKAISVDANQGWEDKEKALERIQWLKNKNVLFVEQPLKKKDLAGALWLKEKSPLPLIADESMQGLEDIIKIKDCFHGINVKLMKCGGLREAYKIIMLAKKHNLKVLIGCMSETSCAISAAAQLSFLADWVDLDGPLLIKKDLFSGLKYTDGKILLSNKPGIGIEKAA
jgi:L-alanine-DL-glutamate epimerase-like enolase superfamily enzyme